MKKFIMAGFACPLVCITFLASVGGCARDESSTPQDQPTPKVPGSSQLHKAPSKTIPVDQEPRYSPVGRRDPFRSYLTDLAAQAAQHQPDRKPEPTEMFELGQYMLTGLVTGTSQPKAMVEDPDTRGHVLRIGSHLGKNGGVVVRIGQEGIVIAERTRDPTGRSVDLSIAIKLQRNETKI